MLGAGVAVCVARSPLAVLHPELYAEDGHVWFQDAYNQGWVAPLLVAHTGYLQTFPRLVAGLGLLVPLVRVPVLFVAVAAAAQVLPAAVIASRRFAPLIASRAVRVGLAALYLVAPNAREVNLNLTNAQWHLALLALLAVLAAPARGAWRAVDVAAVALSGLTGPFGVALVPVAVLVHLARRRRWSAVLLAESATLAIVQLAVLVSSPRGHYGPLGMSGTRLADILGSEIVGGTFLGQATQYRLLLGHSGTTTSILLACAGAALAAAAVALGPLELRLFNLYAALVLGASLLSPVASVARPQWQALALDPQMRYWLFPTLALLADAAWLATRRRPRPVALVGAALLLVALALAVRSDWTYRTLPRVHWRAEVAAFDASPSGSTYVFAIAPAKWTMALVKH